MPGTVLATRGAGQDEDRFPGIQTLIEQSSISKNS